MDERDRTEKLVTAYTVFTPGAPISQKDCFAGRKEQVRRICDAIPSPGRHPIIYGQRGVGKTSLANIVGESISNVLAVKVNCDGADTFETIWNRLLGNTSIDFRRRAWGFSQEEVVDKTSLAAFLGHDSENVSPGQVSGLLQGIRDKWAIFVIDEFDKVNNQKAKGDLADLIKNLSDNNRFVTIVTVGVAGSISELIGHHLSVERNLLQIELPTMSDDEIKAIVLKGCKSIGLRVDDSVLEEVARLSNGFPHYAHLLGLNSAKACIDNNIDQLDERAFALGCSRAVEDSIEKYREAFSKATATTQTSRYPQVLCACAHAAHDDRGVFRATDVVDAMKTVFDIEVSVPSVVPALGDFCAEKRGSVLVKVQIGKRNQYRFADAMMRPFLRIKTKTLVSN